MVSVSFDQFYFREPVISERFQCPKLDENHRKTMAISSLASSSSSSSSSSMKSTLKTVKSLSPADHQSRLPNNNNNPWEPEFKDYQGFIDAHTF